MAKIKIKGRGVFTKFISGISKEEIKKWNELVIKELEKTNDFLFALNELMNEEINRGSKEE